MDQTVEQHRDELIGRLGKAIKIINEREAQLAAKDAVIQELVDQLWNLTSWTIEVLKPNSPMLTNSGFRAAHDRAVALATKVDADRRLASLAIAAEKGEHGR